ncbi:universal stress protein [Actinomadura litoris]|uniref:universal stress protein n=1 Tax=Actinomadura litoris TaxID=2678616 RepID=UPI001FA70F4A|nr:universal stress protein [Actinomadura litoris]
MDSTVGDTMNEQPITGVVVGYDGSESGVRALDRAADEARTRGTPLTVLHAWDVYVGAPIAVPAADLHAMAERTLDKGVEHLRKAAPDLKVRAEGGRDAAGVHDDPVARSPPLGEGDGRGRRGGPREVLMDAADGAALLVVGSRGLGGFRGLLLGSVSHALVHHAPCTVVVVHASESGAGD